MHASDVKTFTAACAVGLPTAAWLYAAHEYEGMTPLVQGGLKAMVDATPHSPAMMTALAGGLATAALLGYAARKLESPFGGAPYRKFLRGTALVRESQLRARTREHLRKQVMLAGIPMPTKLETTHVLLNGSTGTGKSTVITELVYSAIQRGDRMVILDAGGELLSKFGQRNDLILNPYDIRSQGWSFFNEIRSRYDYQRYALSVIPRGKTNEAEEWASYGRLLLREAAWQLHQQFGTGDIRALFEWCTIRPPEELRDFLAGTLAESLFVGSAEATKALSSARFVISDKLAQHVEMPGGRFSIRDWLADPGSGNLWITWRDDMAVALRPLISAWVDVVCTSVLSLPRAMKRPLWLFIDELGSLEKLASLEDALTKGRKKGLRVVAGLQSTSQLDDTYGRLAAQTLRASFRSLVVLGGSRTDPVTSEDMSRSLGEHEVERPRRTRSGGKDGGVSSSTERVRERIVSSSEIARLPDLQAYVSLAGNYPVARVRIERREFAERVTPFVERP